MKKAVINTMILAVIFLINVLYAEEEKPGKKAVSFVGSLATKSMYSSGISDSYTFNRTDATGGFKSPYIDLSAFIRRYFNYQVTDGNGIYEYRSFYEGGLSFEAHVVNAVNITGEYSRADDFSNLKRNTYYGAVELDFSPVILSADYSYEDFEYRISSNTINTEKKNYSFAFEYNFTESFSMDAGYKRDNTYFNTLGYDYYKNIFRLGLTVIPASYLFFIAGGSAGKDSEDYLIYGADCGVTFLIYSRFKLFFLYAYSFYDPPRADTVGGGGGGGSGHGPGKTNPYLASGKEGEAYSSYIFTFGISVIF